MTWGYHRGEWEKTDIDTCFGEFDVAEALKNHWEPWDKFVEGHPVSEFSVYTPRFKSEWKFMIDYCVCNQSIHVLAKDDPDLLELCAKLAPSILLSCLQLDIHQLREEFGKAFEGQIVAGERRERELLKCSRQVAKEKEKNENHI